jgi:hypothetical protein
MKAKKAVKRLKKIENVLAVIIDENSGGKPQLRELLDAARGSIARAKAKLNPDAAGGASKKPNAKSESAKSESAKSAGLTPEGRKKLSAAAKKRWARAKRKGVNAVTGQPLRRTGTA